MTRTHRILRTLFAASMVAALLAGCSSDRGTPSAAAEPQGTSPTVSSEAAGPLVFPEQCFNPHGGQCLGPLEPGTYRTKVFQPGLRYTVPAGWVNAEDLPGNFWLYREDDPQPDGIEGGSYIGIYNDIRAPQGCEEAWAEGVGNTPAELAAWYLEHPGLATSQPREVKVGGLDGLLVDVPLTEDWKGRCPWSRGHPVVPVLIGSGVSDVHHTSVHETSLRLLLLNWQDANITIEITSHQDQHTKQQYLDMVQPIIESLRFDRD